MKKYGTFLFIIGLAILLLSQQKLIMPLVYSVVKSDLFLVDTEDKASPLPVTSNMTDLAFKFCNQYIAASLPADTKAVFSETPVNSWSLGNYQYVVNADIRLVSATQNDTRRYVCRIAYRKGDDLTGVNDMGNWSVNGVDGLDGPNQ